MKKEHKNSQQESEGNVWPLSRRKFFAFTGVATLLAMAGNLLPAWFSSGSTRPSAAYAAGSDTGKSKNILIITGSARVGGNSDLLAEAFAKGAGESGHTVNIFHSGRDRMSGCLYCDALLEHGQALCCGGQF